KALVPQPAPTAHDFEPDQRTDRADQHGARAAFLLADEIETPVDAIGAVDVGKARRSEHDGVAWSKPAIGMRGGIRLMVGLEFDDLATDAVEQEGRPDQFRRNLVHTAGEEIAGQGHGVAAWAQDRFTPTRSGAWPACWRWGESTSPRGK